MTPRSLPRDAFDPCSGNAVVRGFLENLAGLPEPPTAIHSADDMYRYNLKLLRGSAPCAAILYYAKGWQIFQSIERAAAGLFGGLDRTPRLLDFAGGHGRVTRFLSRVLDPGRIWISEIHEDAVSFQRNYFGVQGFLSSPEPEGFRCRMRFPFIVATSFFSHIPPASFSGWLAALLSCLESEGFLLFSALAGELSSDPAGVARGGSLFVAESETTRLDPNVYGTTYVSEEFVRAAVGEAAVGSRTIRRFRRALCALQDLYLVGPPGSEPRFEPIYLPWGDVDLYRLPSATDGIDISGWIRTTGQGSEPARVELRVNGKAAAAVRPEAGASGDYRWSFRLDRRAIGPDDVLTAVARTAEGLENFVGLGTLRTHPPETV